MKRIVWHVAAVCCALTVGTPDAVTVAAHRPADVEFSVKPFIDSTT